MIGIVNYGSGNIRAIANIFERLNIDVCIVDSPKQLMRTSKIILPGVGAFDDSMERLNKSGLREVLDRQVLRNEIPVLGVCVGMQLMACSSEEGNERGLCWFENSEVVRFDESMIPNKPKLPHMGWNNATPVQNHQIFDSVDEKTGFYFLHSYRFICENEHQLSVTNYGVEFVSSARKNNIFGFQFHPEKSHSNGVNLFKNFAELRSC